MLKLSSRPRAGVSLVELMVGMAVGLVVLMGMASMYVNSSRGSRTATTATQLNQELRAVMDIMVNDMRRAGYWGRPTQGAANPFTATTTILTLSNLGTARDCIVYSYDATFFGGTPGTVDPGIDFFGFRLTEGGVVQTLDQSGSTLANTTTACANLAWENLTDERAIQVTELTFDTVGSQCIAFVPATYIATTTASYTQWTTTTGKGRACAPGASGAPSTYPDTTTNAFVETRQINIVLKGKSLTDPSLPEQTLRETVLVRNNSVVSP